MWPRPAYLASQWRPEQLLPTTLIHKNGNIEIHSTHRIQTRSLISSTLNSLTSMKRMQVSEWGGKRNRRSVALLCVGEQWRPAHLLVRYPKEKKEIPLHTTTLSLPLSLGVKAQPFIFATPAHMQSSDHPAIPSSMRHNLRNKCALRASYLERFNIQRRGPVHGAEVKLGETVTKFEVWRARKKKKRVWITWIKSEKPGKKSWDAR